MGRKKEEEKPTEEVTLKEISAEEIVKQYQEEQPEAQDEGENLETVEEEA